MTPSMRVDLLTLTLLALCLEANAFRVRRQSVQGTDCGQVLREHSRCTDRAYQEYQTVWAKGDDGRPDWVARKTCNYFESSIDVCGDGLLVGGCQTIDEVNAEKNRQIEVRLRQVKGHVSSWDSTKCPPVRHYLQRLGLLPADPTPAPVDKCALVRRSHEQCTDRAYRDYQAVWLKGDDGRPDWVARKTCNYITDSIDVCGDGDLKEGCMTQEEVNKRKDYQIGISLKKIKGTVKSWDSSKCPPVKQYLIRLGVLSESSTLGVILMEDWTTAAPNLAARSMMEAEEEDSEDWFFPAFFYYWWSGLTGQGERFSSAWAAFLRVWETQG